MEGFISISSSLPEKGRHNTKGTKSLVMLSTDTQLHSLSIKLSEDLLPHNLRSKATIDRMTSLADSSQQGYLKYHISMGDEEIGEKHGLPTRYMNQEPTMFPHVLFQYSKKPTNTDGLMWIRQAALYYFYKEKSCTKDVTNSKYQKYLTESMSKIAKRYAQVIGEWSDNADVQVCQVTRDSIDRKYFKFSSYEQSYSQGVGLYFDGHFNDKLHAQELCCRVAKLVSEELSTSLEEKKPKTLATLEETFSNVAKRIKLRPLEVAGMYIADFPENEWGGNTVSDTYGD